MAQKTVPLTELDDEVREWRYSQLRKAKISESASYALAAGTGDLHNIIRDKKRGCSDSLLQRIYRED